MKTVFIFAFASFFSVNLFGQWTQLNSGTTQNLNAIYFLNDDTGFIGGDAGITSTTLLKTTDGGLNWTSPNISTVNSIRSICFTTSQIGFLTTSSASQSFKTIDGGSNWTSFNSEIFNAGDIYFKDIDTGFVFSPNNGDDVSYTFNGGATWSHYANGTFNGVGITAIHFPFTNSSIGFATTWDGQIFKTTNAGVSWFQIAQPTSQYLSDVSFSSPSDGYAVGSTFLLKTTDGGANWTIVNSNVGGSKIKIVGSSLYVLSNDSIRVSNNNGLTFTAMSGTITGLNNLQILSSTSGYCVGGSGRIFKLGLTSTVEESPISLNQIKVYPNPIIGSGSLNLEIPFNQNVIEALIYNINGNEIMQFNIMGNSKSINFNVNELPSGIYYLMLRTDQGENIQSDKIVILK
jgi:photosystem II stability/assembly factor-like uncharacterized protein